MQKIRILGACVALGGVALLSGCVGVPGDPYYGGGGYATGGYSSGPYYSEPAPVYVAPAPVYINGGGYYQRDRRPYYDGGRPYYGRPGYPAVRPGTPAVRPPGNGWGGGRPNVGVAPVRPGAGGGPGSIPQPPRGAARLMTSPDSQGQTPP
ncbi:hypothetical protein QTI51_07575 [Variovorax sp. J22G73]|jgi:hypothetical protein|uniref:hypothetical protein n=1 Tax=unclassified Variovorax TaxID=663243 RepID=UPI000D5C424E|nr:MULTISPECIES: hypothetical protein [unclassified Variovorax]MDM0003207.1 hypothetical protein [Variovorax sp. J22R203]MDM0097127.1 hypothetical protein [Variovorax sp. J22G73]